MVSGAPGHRVDISQLYDRPVVQTVQAMVSGAPGHRADSCQLYNRCCCCSD